jgi:hypothetical protein
VKVFLFWLGFAVEMRAWPWLARSVRPSSNWTSAWTSLPVASHLASAVCHSWLSFQAWWSLGDLKTPTAAWASKCSKCSLSRIWKVTRWLLRGFLDLTSLPSNLNRCTGRPSTEWSCQDWTRLRHRDWISPTQVSHCRVGCLSQKWIDLSRHCPQSCKIESLLDSQPPQWQCHYRLCQLGFGPFSTREAMRRWPNISLPVCTLSFHMEDWHRNSMPIQSCTQSNHQTNCESTLKSSWW